MFSSIAEAGMSEQARGCQCFADQTTMFRPVARRGADYANSKYMANGISNFFDLPPQPGDTKLDQTIFEGEFMFLILTRYILDT